MAGSKSYRDGVSYGIGWRRALKSFDPDKLSRKRALLKRVKKESKLDLSEWSKGFKVGYNYERRR